MKRYSDVVVNIFRTLEKKKGGPKKGNLDIWNDSLKWAVDIQRKLSNSAFIYGKRKINRLSNHFKINVWSSQKT